MHQYHTMQNIFIKLKTPVFYLFISSPSTFVNCWWFYCLHRFTFFKTSYSWSHTVYSLFDWLLSLINMHLTFLHILSWLDSSFLLSTDWYSIVWIYHSLFIWGHLGCFQVLAIMNKAAVNTVCGLPWWLSSKESTCQCRRCGFTPWVWKIPWRRKWQPTLVYLPGESHGQRSQAGCSP